MKVETIRLIVLGHISGNMGYCEQSKCIRAADDVLKFISTLTIKEFNELKKQVKQNQSPNPEKK